MPEVQDAIVDAELAGPPRRRPWAEWIYHSGLLLLAGGILVFSFRMRVVEDAAYLPGAWLPLPDSCVSRALWGWNCPGCGLTRSFISLSHGEWAEAVRFNPAGPWAYAFAWLQLPWQAFQLSRLARGREPVFSLWLLVLPVWVLEALFIQWFGQWR